MGLYRSLHDQSWDGWVGSQIYIYSFLWFWLFWGTFALVVLGLHCIRWCWQTLQAYRAVQRRPVPVESVFAAAHSHDFRTCGVCLEDFVEGDRLYWLPCSHVYHADCIDQWFQGYHISCPLCLTIIKTTGAPPPQAAPPNYQSIPV